MHTHDSKKDTEHVEKFTSTSQNTHNASSSNNGANTNQPKTSRVIMTGLSDRERPTRQPTVPPTVEQIKSGAVQNFARFNQEKSGAP
jgi:hypothetical protein